jgi:hypothetical protein
MTELSNWQMIGLACQGMLVSAFTVMSAVMGALIGIYISGNFVGFQEPHYAAAAIGGLISVAAFGWLVYLVKLNSRIQQTKN